MEIKGQYGDDADLKVKAAERWVNAVNEDGSWGLWHYRVVTEPTELPNLLNEFALAKWDGDALTLDGGAGMPSQPSVRNSAVSNELGLETEIIDWLKAQGIWTEEFKWSPRSTQPVDGMAYKAMLSVTSDDLSEAKVTRINLKRLLNIPSLSLTSVTLSGEVYSLSDVSDPVAIGLFAIASTG